MVFKLVSRREPSGDSILEFGSFQNCFPMNSEVVEVLKGDCREAFACMNRTDDDDASSIDSNEYHNSGSTYFISSDTPPRCRLEQLALNILHFHTKSSSYDASTSGCEWWTQVVDCEDDIGFHWDRDYGHEESTGENLYPQLATVTYLTDSGGPTVILNKAGCLRSGDDHSGTANRAILSKPLIGKHIKFDGRFLHAAPSNLIPENKLKLNQKEKEVVKEKTYRITFLVNIWLNHIPRKAVPFPGSSLGNFSTSLLSPELFSFGQTKSTNAPLTKSNKKQTSLTDSCIAAAIVPEYPLPLTSNLPLDLHSWTFVNGGRKYRVSVPLPKPEILRKMTLDNSAILLTYNEYGVICKVECIDSNSDLISHGDADCCRKRKRYWRPLHLGPLWIY